MAFHRKVCLSRLRLAAIPGLVLAILSGAPAFSQGVIAGDTGTGSLTYLRDAQSLSATHTGSRGAMQALDSGQAVPLSLASGDFDQDGVGDVVAGYSAPGGAGILAVHRGNVDAFAPQNSLSWTGISLGQFPSPFVDTASVFQIPRAPDFLAVGRFTGNGHDDVVTAARGDLALYVLAGDGNGGLGSPLVVTLPSPVTALAAGRYGPLSRFTTVLVGTGGTQPKLLVYGGSDNGLTLQATYALSAPASFITFGDMDGDSLPDGVLVSGGQVLILHSAQGTNPKLETVSLPLSASTLLVGSFIHDRGWRQQIAILASDGSINIVAPGAFDARGWTRPEVAAMWDARTHRRPNPYARPTAPAYGGWHVIESLPTVAPFGANAPMLYRARISAQGAEDIMVVNPDAGQVALVSHSNLAAGAATFVPGQLSTRVYAAGKPVAALPVRTNIDARKGLVLLHQGDANIHAMMPLPDPTFFVNRTDDPPPGTTANNCNNTSSSDISSSCSLRQAVIKANSVQGQDTIVLPAGTFQLTIQSAGTFDASTGHLDINDGLNIFGQGPSNTTIQAVNGDQVFSILDLNPGSPDPANQGPGIPVSISSLTIANGNGSTSLLGGGAIAWDAGTDGGGVLSLDAVALDGNSAPVGGGLALSDFSQASNSSVTISNSTIKNNIALFTGGGISVSGALSLTLEGTQVLNNQALDPNAVADGSPEQGGGLFLSSSTPTATQIHRGTIAGNTAGGAGLGEGGGIWTSQALVIDQGTSIANNSAGGSGGGVWSGLVNATDALGITASSIVDNRSGSNGGGIQIDSTNAGQVNARFNRIFGNVSVAGGNGFNNASTATVLADDNWWGCNVGPTVSGSGCDQVQGVAPATRVTLSFTASPTSILAGTSAQLTASLQDGDPRFASNLNAFVNLPVTIQNPVNGALSNVQTAIQPNGSATATFTGGGPGAGGAQVVNFDNQTLTASLAVEDFALSVTPALQSVNGGTNAVATYSGTLTSVSGFSGAVSISCSVQPASGVTVTCPASVSIAAGQTATFNITASTTAVTVAGAYSITVTGTASAAGATGNDVRSSSVQLDVANFTVTPAQPTLTVNAGTASTTNDVLTLASLGGFSGALTLTCIAPPNQAITASCSPNSLSLPNGGSATSVLSVSTSATTPPGQYPINITVAGGGITVLASVNLVVADFNVTAAPASQTVDATTAATYTIQVSSTTGFSGSVLITCSAPSGSGIAIAPNCPASISLSPTVPSVSFSMTANTTSVTSGANTLSISGASGSFTSGTTAQLIAANFSLTPSPTTKTVDVGTAANAGYTITSTAVGGYSGSVQLSATVTPAGSNAPTVSFTPASITSSGSSAMNVATLAATPAGSYTITVTGRGTNASTGANITQTTTVTVVVADFALAGSPASITANAGATSPPVTITGTPVNGFNGTVSFCPPPNVTGLPPGAQASFTSCNINVAPNSTTNTTGMTVTTLGSTAPGTYNLTISGASGAASHTVPLTLNVPGFSLGVSGPGSSQTITAGSTATFNLFGQSLGGFTGTVNLQATVSPARLNATLSASSITLSPTGNGQTPFSVAIATSDTDQPATYTITITATSGNIVQTSTLTLVENASPPTFDLVIAPTSQSGFGGLATFHAYMIAISNFSAPITLNVSIVSGPALPPNALFGFCTTCGTPGGPVPPIYVKTMQLDPTQGIPSPGGLITSSADLTVCPNGTPLPAGTYTIRFTASGGGVTHTQDLTLIENPLPLFTLTATPDPSTVQTVTQGGSVSYTVTISNAQNIPAPFTISAIGVGSFGATANTATLPATGGTAVLTVSTSTATQLGGAQFEINASAGTPALTQGLIMHLQVNPPISLTLGGPQTVVQGQSANFGYTVGNIIGPAQQGISVSATSTPPGLALSLNPSVFAAAGSGTLTAATSAATPPGTYTITVTASDGQRPSQSATTTLTVNAPPGLILSLSGPQTISAGGSTTFTDGATFTGGLTGPVSLSVAGLPAGATATLSPSSFSASGSGTIVVSTAPSTPPGSSILTLTASGGGVTQTANTTLTINPGPSFTLSLGGAQTINSGGSTTFADSVTFTGGFSSVVSLSVSGLPTGATATLNPSSFSASGSGSVVINTSTSVAPGTYPLSLTAGGGSITQTANTTLTINPPPDFTLSLGGAQTINPGDNVTFADGVTFGAGFSGPVSLSVSGLPAVATATLSPNSFSASGSGSVVVSTSTSIAPGTYTLTLTASGGGRTHTAATSFTVNDLPPPPPPPPPPDPCGGGTICIIPGI